MRARWGLLAVAFLVSGCEGLTPDRGDAGIVGNVDGGHTPDGGPICTPESDRAFCDRQAVTCGRASGVDTCGTSRVDVRCGQCPEALRTCRVNADTTGATPANEALREALACAQQTGLPAELPKGQHTLTEKIIVPPGVELVGEDEASYGINGPLAFDSLPVLLFSPAVTGDGLELSAGATLTGVQLQSEATASPGSALIRVNGRDVTISNTRVTNGYWGIHSQDTVDASHLSIVNVSMVAPRGGVYIGFAPDGARLQTVHIWNNNFDRPAVQAFLFRSTPGLTAAQLSAYNYSTTMELLDSPGVNVTGLQGDFCAEGLKLSGRSHINLTAATLYSHQTAATVTGSASLSATGSLFVSNGSPTFAMRSAQASLSLTSSTVRRNFPGISAPGIQVDAANQVVLTGNSFVVTGQAITFNGAPRRATVFGNSFQSGGRIGGNLANVQSSQNAGP